MFCKIFLLIFVLSLTDFVAAADDALKEQKSWNGQKACGSYFLREMFRLFADEKIDNKINATYNKLKKELSKPREKKIAFTAELAAVKTYSGGAVLQFTKVITNIGGGLNTTDGVFYCPVPGLYMFFVNIMSYIDHAYAEIHMNDKRIMYVFTDTSGNNKWKSGSNQVILKLQKGDRVSVKSHHSNKFHPNASHFSGNKL